MKPLLFDLTPFHGNVYMLVAALWWVPELVGTFVQRSGTSANRRDRGSYLALVGGVVAGLLSAFWSAAALPQLAIVGAREPIFWLGVGLVLAGVALRWSAIAALGRSFTRDVATRSDQTVVTAGPYSVVRHPAYSGTLLSLVGAALALANWASLLLAVVIGMAGILYRISVEEQALVDALGQPYRDYSSHTPRLIPFVW